MSRRRSRGHSLCSSSPASSRKVGIPSKPGKSPKDASLIEDAPALPLEGPRPSARLAVFIVLELPAISAALAASRSRQSLAAASVAGREPSADSRIFRKRASGGRQRVRPRRPREPGRCRRAPPAIASPRIVVIRKREQALPQRQQMAREVSAVHRRDVERAAAAPATACRTSCRNGLDAAPGSPSCAAYSPCARRVAPAECSRSRRRPGSRAAQAPCWSATCDGRPRRRGIPGSCPAAASGLPGRRRFRRTPRSCAQASAERGSGRADSAALRRASGRLIHQATAGEANHRTRMGPAAASATGLAIAEVNRRGGGDHGGDPHRPDKRPPGPSPRLRSGLARRSPFEKPLVRDQHPPRRAHDRVQAEKRLVRQARERKRRLGEAPSGGARFGGKVLTQQRIGGLPEHSRAERQRRESGGSRSPTRSRTRRTRAAVQPSSSRSVNAGGTRLRRRLSKIFHRDSPESGFLRRRAAGPGNARQQPPGNLPVAADPAVAPAHVGDVAGRIFLVQLHVAQQPGARVAALPADRG